MKKENVQDAGVALKVCRIVIIFVTVCLLAYALFDLFLHDEPTYIPSIIIAAEAVVAASSRLFFENKKKKSESGENDIKNA